MNFKLVTPSLKIRNTREKAVTVFKSVSIPPLSTIDIFKYQPNIKEEMILAELSPPKGSLYNKVSNGDIIIEDMVLLSMANSRVGLDNIITVTDHGQDKYLTTNNSDELIWKYVDQKSRLTASYPISIENDNVSIVKAGPQTHGYLSREDWKTFKGISTGYRLWASQDFDLSDSSTLKITNFGNLDIPFNKDWIVDGSAILLDGEKNKVANIRLGWFSSEKIEVAHHLGQSVILDGLMTGKSRLFFLVSLPYEMKLPENYLPPPKIVKKLRSEYFNAIDIEYGKNKDIKGDKNFKGTLEAKRLGVGKESTPDYLIDSAGPIRASSITLEKEASQHLALVSDHLGRASWKPVPEVSKIPPKMPYSGQLWVREFDSAMFVFNGEREKWLGFNEFIHTEQSNKPAMSNSYFNENLTSLVLPYDATLVGIVAGAEHGDSWSVEVHKEKYFVEGASLYVQGDTAGNHNFNIDFNAGDKLKVFLNGERVSLPTVHLIFKQNAW